MTTLIQSNSTKVVEADGFDLQAICSDPAYVIPETYSYRRLPAELIERMRHGVGQPLGDYADCPEAESPSLSPE